ncbi:SDR family oxidoreductase [Pigmentiphaga soli]|uniref:SDR family oxidoreductase n=1 Tax=Pigmentiphaga soli TaxID=1007095 RepID=A0ABP8GXR7_9BURK
MNDPKPTGRVALITGASRGIGAAAALALARRGIAPVLAVRRPEAAQEAAGAVRALGLPCLVAACDVADYAAVQRCVSEVLQAWGRLDAVINNAGQIEPQGRLAQTDPAAWAQAIASNLVGPYHVLRAALPELLRRRGAVVNVSTGAAHTPRDGWSAYCSSKAGLYMLSRSVLAEYGGEGLSVYSLQPGVVDTDMQARIRSAGANEISRIPREKLASPARSAAVIAWLADTLPQDLMGSDLSVADADLLRRAGAPE